MTGGRRAAYGMGNEITLVGDGDGLAVIGPVAEVERFLLDQGLDRAPSKALDLHRLSSLTGTGGAALEAGSQVAAESGRWVKLTAESAQAVKRFGLMPSATPGVSHAMIGRPGDIRQWLQIATAPTALLSGPLALSALATMMQQRAIQQQMDTIVAYLKEIDEKVDDILRAQKDAVLAGMIGAELVIEEAMTVRDRVGRVSEITWSKAQATSQTIATTQAYAIRQLDAIAETLEAKADLGDIAKATRKAEPRVREWLAVIARCFQLEDGIAILELDRVLDAAPSDLDAHRLGKAAARENRLELISRSTSRLLAQMDETVRTANAKVLLNPLDSPAAVRSSNAITTGVRDFRDRLGIESGHGEHDARRWSQAAGEVVEKVLETGADGAAAARRFGEHALDRATRAFRSADVDGDGVADRPRVVVAAEHAGAAIRKATTGAIADAGSLLRRTRGTDPATDDAVTDTASDDAVTDTASDDAVTDTASDDNVTDTHTDEPTG